MNFLRAAEVMRSLVEEVEDAGDLTMTVFAHVVTGNILAFQGEGGESAAPQRNRD